MSMLCLGLALAAQVDIARFEKLFSKTPEQVIELVGEPGGKFLQDGTDHWLYDNAVKEEGGKKVCPEILFRKGKSFQITWVPEALMKKGVAVAKGFAGWTPPAEVKEKDFTAADTGVKGKSKADVLRKLGEPDEKRVFNGREVWAYKLVRMSKTDPRHLTIVLEFEGDTVENSFGN